MSITTLSEGYRITRKTHVCFACMEVIPAKTKVKYQSCADEAEVYTAYTCETCEGLLQEFKECLIDNDGLFQEGCVRDTDNEEVLKYIAEIKEELKNEK